MPRNPTPPSLSFLPVRGSPTRASSRPVRWALFAGLMSLSPACSCPGTVVDDLPDAGDGGQACEPMTLTVGDLVLDAQQDVQTIYSAPLETELGGGVGDFLVLNFVNYNERFGSQAVGTFSLAEAPNDNRGTCPECVSVFEDQLTPTSRPRAVFFQPSGGITLDVDPRSGGSTA